MSYVDAAAFCAAHGQGVATADEAVAVQLTLKTLYGDQMYTTMYISPDEARCARCVSSGEMCLCARLSGSGEEDCGEDCDEELPFMCGTGDTDTVTSSEPYTVYDGVGWCAGGPNTAATNAAGEEPLSVDECWSACSSQYSSLVAVDWWPDHDTNDSPHKCWCQTACTSVGTSFMDRNHRPILALRNDWTSRVQFDDGSGGE